MARPAQRGDSPGFLPAAATASLRLGSRLGGRPLTAAHRRSQGLDRLPERRNLGGLLLLGLGLRLLRIRQVPVGNLLPALLVAPLLVAAVGAFR